jgi:signal transduction histidine kinase/DNA-binding response OmpR family regulator
LAAGKTYMASERLQVLEQQLASATKVQERINLMLDICAEWRLFDVEKAKQLADEALTLSRAEDYPLGIGRSLYAIGSSLWQLGDYAHAVNFLNDALQVAKKMPDAKLNGKANNMLGNVYRDMGELSTALGHYLTAQDQFDAIAERQPTGVVMMNLALIFFALADYDSALDNALKSLSILEEEHSEFRLFSIYHTLGNIYFKRNEFDNASTYFYKSLELTQNNTSPHALALSGIGKVRFMQNEFAKAENYLLKAKAISEEFHFIESKIVASFYLGRLYANKQQLSEAVVEYTIALGSAMLHGRKHDEMSVHEYLAQCYEQMGDTASAYFHLKSFNDLRSTIFEMESITQLRNRKVLHDIEVARKDRELALRTAIVKQQFLANMSHEIRTPMNAIIGMTRLLQEKKHLPEQERYLKAIKTSSDNLLVIINDILDISKLESGKFQIEAIPFSLRNVLQGVHQTLRLKADEKGLDFSYTVEQAIPDILVGDPTRISQVLINLAGNAIKFTDNGEVKITIVSKHTVDQQVQLRIQVIDTGIGIDENYVHNLFQKFAQAGSDTARKYGGTGLGLSISKQLVSLMGGNVSVQSKLGQGSTFTIELTLPINESQMLPDSVVEEISNQQISSLANKKVLLVEDNEFNQMLALDTLQDMSDSIQIDVALNGKVAVEKANATLYDLILMDIQMPLMTGVQATEVIRSTMKAPFNEVPIIAMTANVMREDIDQYLSIGMNDYISKPFTPQVLLHKISKYLGVASTKTLQVSDDVDNRKEDLHKRYSNLNFLDGITKGDSVKRAKYIEIFLRNAPQILADAKHSLSIGDRERLKVQVHSLKSQLAYMGVQEEDSNAQAFEKECADETTSFESLQKRFQKLQHICEKTFKEVVE